MEFQNSARGSYHASKPTPREAAVATKSRTSMHTLTRAHVTSLRHPETLPAKFRRRRRAMLMAEDSSSRSSAVRRPQGQLPASLCSPSPRPRKQPAGPRTEIRKLDSAVHPASESLSEISTYCRSKRLKDTARTMPSYAAAQTLGRRREPRKTSMLEHTLELGAPPLASSLKVPSTCLVSRQTVALSPSSQ